MDKKSHLDESKDAPPKPQYCVLKKYEQCLKAQNTVLRTVPGHGTQLERQSLQPFPHEIAAQRHFRRSRQCSLNTNTAIDQPQKMGKIEKERGTAYAALSGEKLWY
jgi:hypothetical protein